LEFLFTFRPGGCSGADPLVTGASERTDDHVGYSNEFTVSVCVFAYEKCTHRRHLSPLSREQKAQSARDTLCHISSTVRARDFVLSLCFLKILTGGI
jgi:hypothetical protein